MADVILSWFCASASTLLLLKEILKLVFQEKSLLVMLFEEMPISNPSLLVLPIF
jgi:hypothetical protein